VFFFFPKQIERVGYVWSKKYCKRRNWHTHAETNSTQQLMSVFFVNPQLVDMGVMGFGMAVGHMLRERLLDGLTGTYYLRTLQWGALTTRRWPNTYSFWEEEVDAEGGYKLMRTLLPFLPSNPEVEDIYDAVNNAGKIQIDEFWNDINWKGPSSPLEKFGDFVNGMMRL